MGETNARSMICLRTKPDPVDLWNPDPEDQIFKFVKTAIILPVSDFYNEYSDIQLDLFDMSKKKCYNKQNMKEHICLYLNYFLKYYDQDKELLSYYYKFKPMIDHEALYNKSMFIYDIKTYFMNPNIFHKISLMVEDNYNLNLNYKNDSNPSLQYTNYHGKILMAMSIMMDILIPIVSHFMKMKNLDTNSFLLEIFNMVLKLSPGPDIYSKLYDTSSTNIYQTRRVHSGVWGKQDIRGNTMTTHSSYCIDNIILNIMPKYTFSNNIISFNFTSIKENTKYRITDISYEFNFVSFSSSDRDEDYNSDFDKFESYMITQNEGYFIQNKVTSKDTIALIERQYGPFSEEEINHYRVRLTADGQNIIDDFQFTLIGNLFFKYFGYPTAFNSIKNTDYIKLMIAAKRLLNANNMLILPYIISSKTRNIQNRKSINRKELLSIEKSPNYKKVLQKYKSTSMHEYILSLMATIASSEFKMIDYNDPELNDKILSIIPEIIYEELLLYILMI